MFFHRSTRTVHRWLRSPQHVSLSSSHRNICQTAAFIPSTPRFHRLLIAIIKCKSSTWCRNASVRSAFKPTPVHGGRYRGKGRLNIVYMDHQIIRHDRTDMIAHMSNTIYNVQKSISCYEVAQLHKVYYNSGVT